MRRINLDHQSATPVRPEVGEAMRPYFTEHFGNPAALHQHGLRARDALARAREQVAAFIQAASPEEILFTADGTEAVNLAVKGTAFANHRRGNHLVVSDIEHPAVLASVEFLQQHGFTATRVKVSGEGLVRPADVRAAITDQTILVAVQHVNPDLGAIQPIREIGAVAAERGVTFFVDCEASAGWLPVDVAAWGAGLVSFSPHRFYGPKGVGVLYRHRRARLTPVIHGGVQEAGYRAGTENVPAIVGAGRAAEIARGEMAERSRRAAELQARLWAGLREKVPYIQLNGPAPGPGRIPTTLNVSVEFLEGEGILLACDMQGVALHSGASCLSKAIKVPPVLQAIGLPHALAQGSILLSPAPDTSDADLDHAVGVIAGVVAKLRALSPAWEEFQRGTLASVIVTAKNAENAKL